MSLQVAAAAGRAASTVTASLASVPPGLPHSSTTPPAPATTADVHYFDVLHPILLSHIRRSNSDGVLALLALPEVSGNRLFWQTCTYREGLLAALLLHVMQHTEQTVVGVPAGSGDPIRSCSSGHSNAHAGKLNPPVTRVTGPLTAYDVYRLLHHCCYPGQPEALLNEGAVLPSIMTWEPTAESETAEGSPYAAAVSRCAATMSLLLCRWADPRFNTLCSNSSGVKGSCEPISGSGDVPRSQDDTDLRLYLQSMLRKVERMVQSMAATDGNGDIHNSSTDADMSSSEMDSNTSKSTRRKRSRSHEGEAESAVKGSNASTLRGDSMHGDQVIDLAAVVAVLQEHYATFFYTNPCARPTATTSATVGDSGEGHATVPLQANEKNILLTATTGSSTAAAENSNSTSRSAGTAPAAQAGGRVEEHLRSSSNTRSNWDAACRDPRISTVDERALTRVEDEAVGNGEDEEGSLDAVAMLQRLPAIAATRWTVPPTAVNTAPDSVGSTTDLAQSHASHHNRNGTPDVKCPPHETVPPSTLPQKDLDSSAVSSGKGKHSSSAQSTTTNAASATSATTARPPTQPPPPPQDAEQARVSAAIRAFDAFTAAFEQQQQQRPAPAENFGEPSSSRTHPAAAVVHKRESAFTPAQRHRGDSAFTSAPAAAVAVAAAAPARVTAPIPNAPTERRKSVPSGSAALARATGAATTSPPHSSTAPPPGPPLSYATRGRGANNHNSDTAFRSDGAAVPNATSATRTIRRRNKFSAKEDAAIMHGVAQFGQGPGAFQYIFHAYRHLWFAGRTPTHLYDHWRGALRRRAMEAVSNEALLLSIEGPDAGDNAAEEEGPSDVPDEKNAPALAESEEQGLLSDIEDSSPDDA